jgi:hypothetical protein
MAKKILICYSLTDPINTAKVRILLQTSLTLSDSLIGQMESPAGILESQGTSQTAYRLFQFLR